jgi:adenine-specific DNA-methyltransferase
LNYIIENDKNVEIKGKTGVIKNWNRSSFCSETNFYESMRQVMNNISTKLLVVSYNNEGIGKKDKLIELFKEKFNRVVVYEQQYNKYKSQKHSRKENVIEYVFIAELV